MAPYRQHDESIAIPGKSKITQTAVDVNQEHTSKTQHAAERFVITKLAVPVALKSKTPAQGRRLIPRRISRYRCVGYIRLPRGDSLTCRLSASPNDLRASL
ncbi:hypothetical protein UYSO10_1024 [Kosakonia radicincitans]|nr:hypothetical protein UYSO10_1024 [Kosakonia radicincitans]